MKVNLIKQYYPFYVNTVSNINQLNEHWQHCGGRIVPEDVCYRYYGDESVMAEFELTFNGNFYIIWFDSVDQDPMKEMWG